MAVVQATPAQQASALNSSAKKYGIPVWVLAGVYGVETGFGSNVTRSSADANGAFQFIPGTAKTYGYPETNAVNATIFQSQADAAAHYLSDLYHQTGNWDTALQRYSGGGYGTFQVKAKLSNAPSGLALALGDVTGQGWTYQNVPGASAIQDGINTATDLGSAAANIANLVTNGENWLRLGEILLGGVLLLVGLRALMAEGARV